MTVKGNSSKQLQPAKQVTYAGCFLSKMTSLAWMQCVCACEKSLCTCEPVQGGYCRKSHT